MADKKNVIIGAAALYVGDFDSTKPAAVAADPYTETLDADTDWRDVGYTQEGVELAYNPEYVGVEVDQALDEVRLAKSSMRVMVNTTFAEATLENLLVVWAQDGATLVHNTTPNVTTGVTDVFTIEGGSLGESPLERQLIAVGNGPENGTTGQYNERTYHVTRCISVESSSHALRRAEATVFPVSFRVLPASTAGAPYGTITDRVRVW
jgi:hypothetical protein